MNYNNDINIENEKKRLVHNIKNVFEKNMNLACYSIFLSTYFFDELFNSYLKQYIGKINIDDTNKIRDMIEKTLVLDLDKLMNEIELIELYNYSKQYIILLMDN